VTVWGNECVIELQSVRLITVHGNKNRIRYKKNPEFTTKVGRYGDYNRIEEKTDND
jgi:hypothetical protein